MISLVVLLLSSASVADEVSIFVDETHEHAWTEVYQTDERRMQFDANYLSDEIVNQQSYPVALVRVDSSSPSKPDSLIRVSISRDARIAIDCANSASTPIEAQAWNRDKGEYEIMKFPAPKFQGLRAENEDLLAPLFQHICGSDWSMSKSQ